MKLLWTIRAIQRAIQEIISTLFSSSYTGELVDDVSNLNPVISVGQTSGEWPMVAQATLVSSTATGLSSPFDQAHYEWDFGDPVYPHTGSTIGMNLAPIAYHSTEWVFVDIMRASREWAATGAGGIGLDPSGHVSSMDANTSAVSYVFQGVSSYPAGNYTCYFDGSGTIDWGGNATYVSSGRYGKETVSITPTGPNYGVTITITSLDVSDPIRNIRLIMPGFEKNAKWRYNPFHPTFLESIQFNSILRFMDWAEVNNSTQVTWESRTTLNHATQDNDYGVALEYQIQLANTLKTNPWFCVPHLASDDYITQMATLIRDTLDEDLVAYLEFSNECWNAGFTQYSWCDSNGSVVFPGSGQAQAISQFYSTQCVRMYDIFETVFSGTSRFKRVMASQRGSTSQHGNMLDEANAYLKVDYFAINAYFGSLTVDGGSETPESTVSGWTATDLFDWINTSAIPRTIGSCSSTFEFVNAEPYNLEMVAYEGGHSVLGYNNNTTIAQLIDDASRSSEMFNSYVYLMDEWERIGGGTFCFFNSCMKWSNTGRWGHLEYQTQPRSLAPKYDAIRTRAESQTNQMELMYHGRTGEVVWTNTDQKGPIASHVYRSPGTYTISGSMFIKNSSGVEQSATTTQVITVTDNFSSVYFDSVSGNDSNDGLSVSSPKQSYESLKTILSGTDENMRVYLKRGSSWTSGSNMRVDASGRRIIPYGSGNKPTITCSATGVPFQLWGYGTPIHDYVIQGLIIDANNLPINAIDSNGDSTRIGFHLIESEFRNSTAACVQVVGDGATQVSVISCKIDHGTGDSHCFSLKMHEDGGIPKEYLSVINTEFLGGDGAGNGDGFDHAVYPSGHRWFDLFRWCRFIGPSATGSFCINYNCQQDGLGIDNEYFMTDGCDFTGWKHALDHGAGGGSLLDLGAMNHHIIQDNAFHDLKETSSDVFYGANLKKVAVRDNIFYGLKNSIIYQLDSSALDARFYRNNGYGGLAATSDRFFRIGARGTFPSGHPNYHLDGEFIPGAEYVFYDNAWSIIGGANNNIVEYLASDAGSYTFSDQYYAVGVTNPFKDLISGSNISFASWQATYGTGNTYSDPGWFDPDNGDFSINGP